jgi:hypothetical protein
MSHNLRPGNRIINLTTLGSFTYQGLQYNDFNETWEHMITDDNGNQLTLNNEVFAVFCQGKEIVRDSPRNPQIKKLIIRTQIIDNGCILGECVDGVLKLPRVVMDITKNQNVNLNAKTMLRTRLAAFGISVGLLPEPFGGLDFESPEVSVLTYHGYILETSDIENCPYQWYNIDHWIENNGETDR